MNTLTLTAHQRRKQQSGILLHYAREARMPEPERPRISPQRNQPKPANGVHPHEWISMRTCVENPEEHPNDFRYLYKRTGSPNDPTYVWFTMEGQQDPPRTFPSIVQALSPYILEGWEDASW